MPLEGSSRNLLRSTTGNGGPVRRFKAAHPIQQRQIRCGVLHSEERTEGPALRALLQVELNTFGSRFASDDKQQASVCCR